MIVSVVSILVAIIGGLLYLLPVNPKLAEIGRILFLCGVGVTVYMLAGKTVRLL